MDFLAVFLIALGLSADCFAVAISSGASANKLQLSHIIRLALAFGFAQAVMPLIGWLAGRTVVGLISSYDHWIAFGLLAIIGGRMVWGALRSGEEHSIDVSKGLPLLMLAVATSIDALAVGLTLAFLNINVLLAAGTIGVVAFSVTTAGVIIGKKASQALGKWTEVLGGLVLIGIGVRVLVSHLLGG